MGGTLANDAASGDCSSPPHTHTQKQRGSPSIVGTLGEVPAPSKRGVQQRACRAQEGSPPAPSWGPGSDSHIHQLGRLVHPHGKAILALRGDQQLLHRGAHRLHPGAEERGVSARPLTGRSVPARPSPLRSTYFCAALSHATSSSRVMLQL